MIEMVRMSDGSSMYVGTGLIICFEVGGRSIAAAGTTWWSLSSLQSGILDLSVLEWQQETVFILGPEENPVHRNQVEGLGDCEFGSCQYPIIVFWCV